MEVFRAVRDLLIPARCVCCGGRLLRSERHLCLSCLADLPYTYFWTTPHNKMADAFNSLIQRALSDDAPYQPYSRATALFYYQGAYESLTKAVKYGGDARLGVWLGRQLGARLAEAGFAGGRGSGPNGGEAAGSPDPAVASEALPPVTAVVPVPLHWRRRWKRGYNQAELIARGAAAALGVPLRTDLLRKARSTGSQTALSQEERLANVARAFRANRRALARLATSAPSACHLLLIDDVFTTGATLFSVRQALMAADPNLVISIATLAYAQ